MKYFNEILYYMESYITDQQLIEGIIASLVWGIFFIYMRERLDWPSWIEGGLAWMMVWVARKFGITIYNSLKQENKWDSYKLYLLPRPKIVYDSDEKKRDSNVSGVKHGMMRHLYE